jgi:hypothetical protein
MNIRMAVAGLLLVGVVSVGAARPAAAQAAPKEASQATIERIMALAAEDLALRRADLGLIGSTLPTTPIVTPGLSPSSDKAAEKAVLPAPAASATPATNAVAAKR